MNGKEWIDEWKRMDELMEEEDEWMSGRVWRDEWKRNNGWMKKDEGMNGRGFE